MTTKTCKECGLEKAGDDFPAHGRTCKACWIIWQRSYRQEQRKAYLLLHPKQPKPILTHKSCSMCGEDKAIEEYNWCNKNRSKRAPYCRPCHGKRSYADKLRRGNPERESLKYRCNSFGTTLEWYDKTHSEQDGKCALCGREETHPVRKGGKPRRLAIDHDHANGHVRGLLCFRCNTALNQLELNGLEWSERAVEYLKRHKET
jgi:hypothetical protein